MTVETLHATNDSFSPINIIKGLLGSGAWTRKSTFQGRFSKGLDRNGGAWTGPGQGLDGAWTMHSKCF